MPLQRNQHHLEPRNWIAFPGMAALVAFTFLAAKFAPHRGTTAVLCLWDFGFYRMDCLPPFDQLAGSSLRGTRPANLLRQLFGG
jgi:hypothetical protein